MLLKAELPQLVHTCIYRLFKEFFWSVISKLSSSKLKCNVKNACVNGKHKRAFKRTLFHHRETKFKWPYIKMCT